MTARTLALAAVAVAGCNWSLHRMQRQPGCRVAQETLLLPGGACNLQPPAGIVPAGPPERPPVLTRALVLRGRDRFEKFCSPCHGVAGEADTLIAHDMKLRPPPSLVSANARQLTDAHYLVVMEHGYGLMPSYGTVLSLRDRYAIMHYVRVLQRRKVRLADLPAALQQEVKQWLR